VKAWWFAGEGGFVATALLAAFGVFGVIVVRDPDGLMNSLKRLPQSGATTYDFKIEPGNDDPTLSLADIKPQKIEISLSRSEIDRLEFLADVNMRVSAFDDLVTETVPRFQVQGGDPFVWEKREEAQLIFPNADIDALYVWNSDVKPTTLQVTAVTAPENREVAGAAWTALVIVVVFGLYLLMRAASPKISAVALATAKSEMAQPLFLICMALGFCGLTLFLILPYNTFGEDIKMLKDTGLFLIMVLAILTCLWAASNSVAEEIEGRTALTLLSKPIGRAQFILGKFAGIIWVAAVMFLLLGLWFLIMVAYKPIYDARETANVTPDWHVCYAEMVQVSPGLLLGFFETIVLAAISVAISTRLPMLANFIVCASIFVLGHLTPLIVKSSVGNFEPVVFVARLIATVLPVLEHFDIKPAIAGGRDVPLEYLGWAALYCVIYSAVAMLFALTLFEDRDLA
ncbi:MAG: ABC transporter permease, partial [Planctomycetales bacterium]|nr:ABC transporter permease [Planctomycetales bacterium]